MSQAKTCRTRLPVPCRMRVNWITGMSMPLKSVPILTSSSSTLRAAGGVGGGVGTAGAKADWEFGPLYSWASSAGIVLCSWPRLRGRASAEPARVELRLTSRRSFDGLLLCRDFEGEAAGRVSSSLTKSKEAQPAPDQYSLFQWRLWFHLEEV